jgi:hypothetical protein
MKNKIIIAKKKETPIMHIADSEMLTDLQNEASV